MDYSQRCKNGEWPTPQRARVISLALDCHLGASAISKITGVPPDSVDDILASNSARRPGKDREGRPPVLTDKQIDEVIKYLGHNFHHRALPWKNLAAECHLDCSTRTLQRALAKRGYHKCVACPKPFISESARQQRLEFIVEHRHWSYQWEDVIWSDESTFYTGKLLSLFI